MNSDPERGDRALADFAATHGESLVRFGFQLTHDRASAQDLAQDAFIKVLTGTRRGSIAPRQLVPYVKKVMLHDYLKDAKRRRALPLNVASRAIPDRTDEIADRQAVWAALESLPPRQRAALVLRHYEDLPDREITSILRCRPATVRTLISRGSSTIREALRPMFVHPKAG
ncbi:sigma-70 family RNA polymerase sigma factor [Jatrophihabitans telluris]|uniref:Sigma-70 family RNA polymerase sigma factor n=1 Tax=Jatrophihabitans telluris TaxID=2038343 RepID=A0ABY4QZ69_9ACTN|nr:sigma-70 family RNA polymerase sigma factor [Jatrophihabitans telluris]UQX88709.1 sigma-70 family RNA polymerase sigma factor [Jatrophihabitans telluris]